MDKPPLPPLPLLPARLTLLQACSMLLACLVFFTVIARTPPPLQGGGISDDNALPSALRDGDDGGLGVGRGGGDDSSSTRTPAAAATPTVASPDASGCFFHFCGAESLTFPSQEASASGDKEAVTIPIQYQCRGEAYDNFTDQMVRYAEEAIHRQNESSSGSSHYWGKRTYPLPDGATVFVMGNSHTRQTLHSLLCSYGDRVTSVARLDQKENLTNTFEEIQFSNGATMVVATNSPFVYSPEWPENFRRRTKDHRSIGSYDAIVLGSFNLYSPEGAIYAFHKNNMAAMAQHPDEIDFVRVPPPSLESVVERYPHMPVIALPMFSLYGQPWERAAHDYVDRLRSEKSLTNETTHAVEVVALRGRRHVEALGMECGSDGRTEVGVCLMAGDDSEYGQDPVDMHRCTGPQGGHADLLAWDLIEALHRLIRATPV